MSLLLDRRRAGVLLHPTSLPGPGPRGVLGADARRFVDLLAAAGFSVWQTLPLGPVDQSLSPYQMKSAHAGSTDLIDPADLVSRGWLPEAMMDADAPTRLRACYQHFRSQASATDHAAFDLFVQQQRSWLLPYSLFEHHRRISGGQPWWEWPEAIRQRDPATMTSTLAQGRDSLRSIAFEQYLFDLQWQALREYARSRGVLLFGDLPFYLDLDSVELWWHRKLFRVDPAGRPEAVAGVPPDYFNAEGQLWGNPLYDWDAMRAEGFRWWVDRIRGQLHCFDLLRIDHFRALESYWEVPAGAATARDGRWRAAPGAELLATLAAEPGIGALVAEDLGSITPEVRALRDQFSLPRMLVLQFAFDGSPQNPYLPANHVANAVVYTGTHDNDTTLGWYTKAPERERDFVRRYLRVDGSDIAWDMIRLAMLAAAHIAIVPLQDCMGLGSEARMNTPAAASGNWSWRFLPHQLNEGIRNGLAELAELYGRAFIPTEERLASPHSR